MASLPTVPGTLGFGKPCIVVILIICIFSVDAYIDKILREDLVTLIELYSAYSI